MDWTTGSWTNPQAGDGPRWRVVIAGDWAPRRAYENLLAEDPVGCYGDLLPVLQDHDLRIVNVETVLGDEGAPIPKNGPNLKGRADSLKALTTVPWDVATLCNNHVYDFGPEGLRATLDRLHGAGLQTVGAGLTQAAAETPLRLEVNGVPVAIVNCGEGEENRCQDGGPGVSGFDEERLAARVRDLRVAGHVVLVICHAGREYTPLPPPYIQGWYRRLAAAGAHLVVGGHPHVPQGVEIHAGCPIAYSTSNFLFWMDNPPKSQQGYAVQAEFAGRDLARLQLIPYQAGLGGIRRMTAAEQAALFRDLADVSAPLSDPAKVAAHWDAYSDTMAPGMLKSCRNLLGKLDDDPLTMARNLRNYFDTPAHRELLLTWLRRVMEDRVGQCEPWAVELLERWKR